MNTKLILAASVAALMLSACGDAPEEENAASAEPVVEPAVEPAPEKIVEEPEPEKEHVAVIEVSGSTNWNISTDSSQLTCQRAVMRNPFRAQWFDGKSRIGLLASGFPLDDGSDGTEIDSFRLTSLASGEISNATLTDMKLTVKALDNEGGAITFEVIAEGSIESGGSFKATGICRG
jgi:hypothetical protein